MHETTVRFSDELWARIQQASKREGTSAAQLVREATVAYLAVQIHVSGLRREVAIELRHFDRRMERMADTLRRHGLR